MENNENTYSSDSNRSMMHINKEKLEWLRSEESLSLNAKEQTYAVFESTEQMNTV